MNITFAHGAPDPARTLIFPVARSQVPDASGAGLDEETARLLAEAVRLHGFNGSDGQRLDLVLPAAGGVRRIVLLGAGDSDTLDAVSATALGDSIAAIDGPAEAGADVWCALPPALLRHAALGASARGYRYDRFLSRKPKAATPASLRFLVADAEGAEHAQADVTGFGDAVAFARDLANAPPNAMTPTLFAEQCRTLEALGVEVEILDVAELQRLGMGALIGVGQGSAAPPCVAVLQWRGGAPDAAPVALVGKGVTFDSGGLLPKQPEEMWDMKYDRGGAAAVAGAIRALALRGAKANVVGVIGLAENMPSGSAMRPGDILTSHAGLTIEVLHTDAEGRLLLADVLSYAIQRFRPRAVVDIATLTGGLTSVLADQYAGLYASDEDLAGQLLALGESCGERLWRLPLCKRFDEMLDSPVADMQNIFKPRFGGTATAAQFLRRFVGDTPWAHLDILGMAWRGGRGGATCATGYGVKLLATFAEAKA